MSRKQHEDATDLVGSLCGSRTHKVSDGIHTGWGSSRRLAEAACEEAENTNREYVAYTVDPKDDGIVFSWNHYGPLREQEKEVDQSDRPSSIEKVETEHSGESASSCDGGVGFDPSFGLVKLLVWAVGAYLLYLYVWDLGIGRLASLTGLPRYKQDGFDSGNLLFLLLVGIGGLAAYRLRWAGVLGCIVIAAMYFAPRSAVVQQLTPQQPPQQPRIQQPIPQNLGQQPKQPPQTRFEPVRLPNLSPAPVYLGRHPTNGDLTFNWGGRSWLLPDIHKPYRYHCAVAGQLRWCWPNPPNPTAAPCQHKIGNTPGWCWKD